MPSQLSYEQRRRIVTLRALDYDKQEIADRVGVSRNTVRRHLNEVREEIVGDKEEIDENLELKLAEFLFDPNELAAYLVQQSNDILPGGLGTDE